MNLEPGSLAASFLVSGVGYVLFKYGRTQRRMPHVGIGVLMMVYPYFISEVPWMLATMAGLLLVLWLMTQLGL